jgi:hypothetical protein
MFEKDFGGRTFLHYVSYEHYWQKQWGGSIRNMSDVMKDLASFLPRRMMKDLSDIRDCDGKTARDLSIRFSLTRDYLDQAGSYQVDIYPLKTAPHVLVFYSTTGRQFGDSDPHGAEKEKECVENFFTERNFPCSVEKNPTADRMFSSISKAQKDSSLTGLIVFVMSHGQNGMVAVEGCPSHIKVDDIINSMCQATAGKPKVKGKLFLCIFCMQLVIDSRATCPNKALNSVNS